MIAERQFRRGQRARDAGAARDRALITALARAIHRRDGEGNLAHREERENDKGRTKIERAYTRWLGLRAQENVNDYTYEIQSVAEALVEKRQLGPRELEHVCGVRWRGGQRLGERVTACRPHQRPI